MRSKLKFYGTAEDCESIQSIPQILSDTLLPIWNGLMPQQKGLYDIQADRTAAVARFTIECLT